MFLHPGGTEGREGGREKQKCKHREREGGREEGREGGREGGMEGGREGEREGGTEMQKYPQNSGLYHTLLHFKIFTKCEILFLLDLNLRLGGRRGLQFGGQTSPLLRQLAYLMLSAYTHTEYIQRLLHVHMYFSLDALMKRR